MKLPYGYVLVNEEILVHEEKADAVRSIFEYYLAGASLGKIVDMLYEKGITSPSGNLKWGRSSFFLIFLCFANCILGVLCFWANIHLSVSAYLMTSFVIGLPH